MSILGRGFPQQAIILQKSAAAGGAITYNTGTTAQATAVAHTTQPTLTIPAGVLNNDVMLVAVSMFTFTPTSPGITLTPTVGSWSPVAGGLKASTASSGFTQFGSVWSRTATGSDAGTTLTFAFTGTPGSTDQFWWSIAIVSYTGAASIDVASDASGDNVSGGVVNACPSISTGAANDWAITIGAIGVNGSGTLTSDPVGTATTRQDANNSGVCVRITDSNGSVGASGTSIGGSLFGASAPTWWIDYTIGLAVATSGTTPISSSDASNAAVEAGSVAAAFTSTDVSNAATESSSESASFTSADASNAATEANTIKVSSSDASNAATEAGSASASFTATDVSNAAAEAATVSFSSADASNAATETNAVSVGITSTDASNAAVDSSGTVSVSSADPANAATEAGSVHAAFTATDASNAATETNIVTVSNSDVSNAATETNVVAVSSSDASAAAVEAGSVHAAFTTTDASAAAVDAAVNVAFSSADTSNAATETNSVSVGITVTATQGGTTHNGMLLRLKVLTGVALSSPIGNFLGNGSNPQQAAIFTTVTGSYVYIAAQSQQSTTLYTANGLTTIFDNFKDTTNGAIYGTGRSTSATGTPGSTTLGFSAPTHTGELCMVEILPNGTILEDASSPAAVSTTTATSVSTASFSPPGGSFLVAMVVSAPGVASETIALSDTSGLTWTQQSFDLINGAAVIFTAPFNIIISDSDSFSGADTGSAHAAFTSTDASAAAADTGAVTTSVFNADTSNAATEAGSVAITVAVSSSDASNAATETNIITVPISSSDAFAAAVDSTGSVHAAFTAADVSNAAAEASAEHAAFTATDASNAAVEVGGILKNVSDSDTFSGIDSFVSISVSIPAVFVDTSTGSTGSGGASSFTVPVPGAAQVGNLMLIYCATGTAGPPLFSSPGWTAIAPSTPNTNRTGTLLYRVLTGSEGASVPISVSVTALCVGTSYVISGQGAALFDPVPTISGQVNASSTAVTAAGVTTVDGFNLLVWFGFDGKSGSLGAPPVLSPPTGFTQRGVQVDNTSTVSAVNMGMIVADNIVNTPGATGAEVGSQASSTINGGMLVSIAPGAGNISVGDFDTFGGAETNTVAATFSSADASNAAVDSGIVISTNPASSDASNAATEAATIHAAFSAADSSAPAVDGGLVNNQTSTPSSSDASNPAVEGQGFSIHISSSDAFNATVDASTQLSVRSSDASNAATETQALSAVGLHSSDTIASVESAGVLFQSPLLLRGAKVVTTGTGGSSLNVPAQAGTQIGDLIMIYAAGGWTSSAPWQAPVGFSAEQSTANVLPGATAPQIIKPSAFGCSLGGIQGATGQFGGDGINWISRWEGATGLAMQIRHVFAAGGNMPSTISGDWVDCKNTGRRILIDFVPSNISDANLANFTTLCGSLNAQNYDADIMLWHGQPNQDNNEFPTPSDYWARIQPYVHIMRAQGIRHVWDLDAIWTLGPNQIFSSWNPDGKQPSSSFAPIVVDEHVVEYYPNGSAFPIDGGTHGGGYNGVEAYNAAHGTRIAFGYSEMGVSLTGVTWDGHVGPASSGGIYQNAAYGDNFLTNIFNFLSTAKANFKSGAAHTPIGDICAWNTGYYMPANGSSGYIPQSWPSAVNNNNGAGGTKDVSPGAPGWITAYQKLSNLLNGGATDTVTVTAVTNQSGNVGGTVSLQIHASSSGSLTLSYGATGLPPGLSIDPDAGLITGSLTSAGSFTPLVTVSDTSGAFASRSWTWAVTAVGGDVVTVAPPGPQTNDIGDTVDVQMAATSSSGFAISSWSATGLPPGLTIDAPTGLLEGSPTTTGTFSTVVTALDANGVSGSTTVSWTIDPGGGGAAQFFWKIATASDVTLANTGGFYTFTSADSKAWDAGIYVLGNENPSTPFDPPAFTSGEINAAASNVVTVAGFTTVDAPDMLVWFGLASNINAGNAVATISPPTGYTTRAAQVTSSDTNTNNVGLLIADKPTTVAGSTGATVNGSLSISQLSGGLLMGIDGGVTNIISADSFTAAETQASPPIFSSDVSPKFLDAGELIVVAGTSISSSDTAHGTDGTESILTPIVGADSFTGLDTGAVNEQPIFSSDTGSGLDAVKVLSPQDTDSFTVNEIGVSPATRPESADTGLGSETQAVTPLSADTGSAAESASIGTVLASSADTATGTDVGGVLAPVSDTDESSPAAESGTPGPHSADASAATVDSTGTISIEIFASDTFSGAEASTEAASIFGTDSKAAISLPYFLGSAVSQSLVSTLSVTVGATTNPGDDIVVGANINNSNSIVSVTDSQGNLYVPSETTANQFVSSVFVAKGTIPLVNGVDTVTVTYGGTPLAGTRELVVIGGSGIGALDVNLMASAGSGTTVSVTSPALAQAAELVVVFETNGFSGGLISWAPGWAPMGSAQTAVSQFSSMAAQIVSSAAPVTASGTLAVSTKWNVLMVSLASTASSVVEAATVGQRGTDAFNTTVDGGEIVIPLTFISSADTFSGVDAVLSLSLQAADSFSGVDSGAVKATFSDTDAFTGNDFSIFAGPLITSSDSFSFVETGAVIGPLDGTETLSWRAETPAVVDTLSSSDSAHFTDAQNPPGPVSADIFHGVDSAVQISVSSTDAVNGVDTQTLHLSDSDTFHAAEAVGPLKFSAATETLHGLDVGVISPSTSDSFSGVSGTAFIKNLAADVANQTVEAVLSTRLISADAMRGADASSPQANVPSSDTFSAFDIGWRSNPSDTDAFSAAADSGTVHVLASDTFHGVEATGSFHMSSADTWHGAETAKLSLTATETAHGTEGAGLVEFIIRSSDSFTNHEAVPSITVKGADTFHGTDNIGLVKIPIFGADTYHGVEGSSLVFFITASRAVAWNTQETVISSAVIAWDVLESVSTVGIPIEWNVGLDSQSNIPTLPNQGKLNMMPGQRIVMNDGKINMQGGR